MSMEGYKTELEVRIKLIFKKDSISDDDIKMSKHLIKKWKQITNWVEDKTPVLLQTI